MSLSTVEVLERMFELVDKAREEGLNFKEVEDEKSERLKIEYLKSFLALIENGEEDLTEVKDILKNAITDRENKKNVIESAVAKKAKDYKITVDKLSQRFFDNRYNSAFYDGVVQPVQVFKETKKDKSVKIYYTRVLFDIKELKDVHFTSGIMLSPFLLSIHNAIVSLWLAGNKIISINMIYRLLTGYENERRQPEKQMLKMISEAIKILTHTRVTVDLSEEAKKFGYDKKILNDSLIPARIEICEINGKECETIKIHDEPILWTYAKQKGQISTCPVNLLKMPLSLTPENIIVREYIIEQILTILNEHNKRNNIIRYDTLYEYLGLQAPTAGALRKKKFTIREKVTKILDSLKDDGLITGYMERKEDKEVAKVEIFFTKQKELTSSTKS